MSSMEFWDEDGPYVLHPIGRQKKPAVMRPKKRKPKRLPAAREEIPTDNLQKDTRVVVSYGDKYYAATIRSRWKRLNTMRYSICWEHGVTAYGGAYGIEDFLLFPPTQYQFHIGDTVRAEVMGSADDKVNHSFQLGTVIAVRDGGQLCDIAFCQLGGQTCRREDLIPVVY